MVSVTISVPENVRHLMKESPDVNWSGLVRTCIIEKAKRLAMKKEMLRQLGEEKEFNDWAVKMVRDGRKLLH